MEFVEVKVLQLCSEGKVKLHIAYLWLLCVCVCHFSSAMDIKITLLVCLSL